VDTTKIIYTSPATSRLNLVIDGYTTALSTIATGLVGKAGMISYVDNNLKISDGVNWHTITTS
jgi:hypothetical protein